MMVHIHISQQAWLPWLVLVVALNLLDWQPLSQAISLNGLSCLNHYMLRSSVEVDLGQRGVVFNSSRSLYLSILQILWNLVNHGFMGNLWEVKHREILENQASIWSNSYWSDGPCPQHYGGSLSISLKINNLISGFGFCIGLNYSNSNGCRLEEFQ